MARSAGQTKQVRQIQELFHGRFEENEIEVLLDRHNWNTNQTVEYIFSTEPRDIRQEIGDHTAHPETIEFRVTNGVALADHWQVVENPRSIPKTTRQFACETCDHVWWRKVPNRKMVSKCHRCQLKYEAIPRRQEWGWAEFHCGNCGNVFRGHCQRITTSPCHACQHRARPVRVIPGGAGGRGRGGRGRGGQGRGGFRRMVDDHQCNAPDCPFNGLGRGGRGRGRGGDQRLMIGAGRGAHTCVHPRNRTGGVNPKVVVPSNVHVSSRSTIDTCLTQDDLNSLVSAIGDIDIYVEGHRLPPIFEDNAAEGDAESGEDDDRRRAPSSNTSDSTNENNANSGADADNM